MKPSSWKSRGAFDRSQANHVTPKGKYNRKRNSKQRRQTLKELPYQEYLTTKHWRKKRLTAIKHHGRRCNRCGRIESLEVHHKTYEYLGRERMEDLEVLCEGCHRHEHGVHTKDTHDKGIIPTPRKVKHDNSNT